MTQKGSFFNNLQKQLSHSTSQKYLQQKEKETLDQSQKLMKDQQMVVFNL